MSRLFEYQFGLPKQQQQYKFICISRCMAQSSVGKALVSPAQKQSLPSLNQLSISSINEKQVNEPSLDFSQEKHLLNQISIGASEHMDEYGLAKPGNGRVFCKKQFRDAQIPLLRGSSLSRFLNFENSQKNLCFNKQMKRKKISSKSKQKSPDPSALFTTCHSLKQLKLSSNVPTYRKSIQADNTTTISKKPQVDIIRIAKAPSLPLKIYEAPLDSFLKRQNGQHFFKMYHHLPDDFKLELNDLTNWRNELEYNQTKNDPRKLNRFTDVTSDPADRNKARSLITIDLKRSWHSKPEQKSPRCYDAFSKSTKMSEIHNRGANQVVEVSKPLFFDCKSSSFYSSRTEEYQSPISKDSASTAEGRMVRRNQTCKTPQQSYYGCLQPFARSKPSRK